MQSTFEVRYQIYDDAARLAYSTPEIRTVVVAFDTYQVEAMINAQYNNRVRIWSIIKIR